MLKNYLTIAIRNLLKHKVYSLVSILGLAVGISFFTLIFLLISYELSYDRHFRKSKNTYRVIQYLENKGVGEKSASAAFPMGPTLERFFNEYVETAVRLFNFQVSSHAIASDLHSENQAGFYFADAKFFSVFNTPLLSGNPDSVLIEPWSVVISRQMAKTYFGDQEAIGQKLLYENRVSFTVTGVFDDFSKPSHLQYDFLASFASLETMMGYYGLPSDSWIWNPCWTYVVLKKDVTPEQVEEKLRILVERVFPAAIKKHVQLFLQPLEEIHLYSKLDYEISLNGDIKYIYIFSGIALLMLVITTSNFTNLSTARSSVRAKEIGIRKAIGADKSELIEQFLVESIFISLISIFFSLMLVEILLPVISEILGSKIDLTRADKSILLACIVVSTVFVGIVASLYPSYYLARFRPSEVLSGTLSLGVKSKRIRSVLVVIQLVITVFFLISTYVSFKQAHYLRTTDVGFHNEDLIVLSLPDVRLRSQYKELKEAFITDNDVISVTGMQEVLGINHQTNEFYYESENGLESMFFPSYAVRADFLTTFDLKLVAGRDFSKEENDQENAILINEAMIRFMGWSTAEEALGKMLSRGNRNQKVIGVIADFNYESLHNRIDPLVIDLEGNTRIPIKYLAIRTKPGHAEEALECIKKIWSQKITTREIEWFFLKNQMSEQYQEEIQLGKISFYFANVSIFIAILGLFGLSSFVVDQRKKEVAVRKALGVTDWQIMVLLSKEFIQLVAIALLISWPASYIIMLVWLEDFPFTATIGLMPFVVSGLVVFMVTMITISYHTIKASLKVPVRDLQGV